MSSSKIFRQKSLDKLSSPEQLDMLMKVTNSRAWLVLIGVMVIIAVVIFWSVVGRIATRVPGQGILIKSGGIHDIVSIGTGQLSAVYVREGDAVQKGQVVARVAQPEINQALEKAKSRLKELRRQHTQLLRLGSEGKKLRTSMVGGQRSNLMQEIRSSRERMAWLSTHLTKQQNLLEQGLVTNQAVQATRQELQQVRNQIETLRTRLQTISVTSQESKGQREREILRSQLSLNEGTRQIDEVRDRLETASRVISTYSGRVLEIRASVGEIVHAGRSLITIEPTGSEGLGLNAMIYVPVSQGKLLKPGMRLQVSPVSIRKEEFGVMVGIVSQVSKFPSTAAGMKRVLKNDLLVQQMLKQSGLAPIAVKAELIPDPRTVSGFRWTSKKGPPVVIGPGTPCAATIAVREARPIELVVPALRRILGVGM